MERWCDLYDGATNGATDEGGPRLSKKGVRARREVASGREVRGEAETACDEASEEGCYSSSYKTCVGSVVSRVNPCEHMTRGSGVR